MHSLSETQCIPETIQIDTRAYTGDDGPVSYTVMLGNGKVVKRHIDQLLAHLEPYLPAGVPEGRQDEPTMENSVSQELPATEF